MFNWRSRPNRDARYRVLALAQVAAALVMLAGLPLPWWDAARPQSALDLMGGTLGPFRARDPEAVTQPLLTLWFVWPFLLLAGARAVVGTMVAPVAFRRLAAGLWFFAAAALAHFYIAYGGTPAADAPLQNGAIGPGFWVTVVGAALCQALIIAEMAIRLPDRMIAQRRHRPGPVTDPGKLARGEFVVCAACGSRNEITARACYQCHILLLPAQERDDRPEAARR